MKKKECIIFGSTGKLGKHIVEIFLKNGYFIHGISKNSKPKKKINNYKHYFFDIRNKLNSKIKKLVLSKNLNFIIFAISKKEENKNFEFDTKLLMDYHLFFPAKIANILKSRNINLIIINSNCIFSSTCKFPYAVSKLASAYFINYTKKLFPNLKFFSILMGKIKKKNIDRMNLVLKKLIKRSSQFKSKNFPLAEKQRQLKFY